MTVVEGHITKASGGLLGFVTYIKIYVSQVFGHSASM